MLRRFLLQLRPDVPPPAGVGKLRAQDEQDERVKFIDAGAKVASAPSRVDVSYDLDVLLRHRPRSIAPVVLGMAQIEPAAHYAAFPGTNGKTAFSSDRDDANQGVCDPCTLSLRAAPLQSSGAGAT